MSPNANFTAIEVTQRMRNRCCRNPAIRGDLDQRLFLLDLPETSVIFMKCLGPIIDQPLPRKADVALAWQPRLQITSRASQVEPIRRLLLSHCGPNEGMAFLSSAAPTAEAAAKRTDVIDFPDIFQI